MITVKSSKPISEEIKKNITDYFTSKISDVEYILGEQDININVLKRSLHAECDDELNMVCYLLRMDIPLEVINGDVSLFKDEKMEDTLIDLANIYNSDKVIFFDFVGSLISKETYQFSAYINYIYYFTK